MADSLSVDVPAEIADDERLARNCSTGNVVSGGRVKPRAFLPTKYPLDLSVDRVAYRDVQRHLANGKTAVVVSTSEVRQTIPDVMVEADPVLPENPAHALIKLVASRTDRPELMPAEVFAQVEEAARMLAAMAKPIE